MYAHPSAAALVDLVWLLYSIVPTTRVPNRDALVGAFVATLLFEEPERRFRALYRHVPVISAHLWRTCDDPILFVWVYWTGV